MTEEFEREAARLAQFEREAARRAKVREYAIDVLFAAMTVGFLLFFLWINWLLCKGTP